MFYTFDDHSFAKLQRLQEQLHGGSDRERDYGHRLWLILSEAVSEEEPGPAPAGIERVAQDLHILNSTITVEDEEPRSETVQRFLDALVREFGGDVTETGLRGQYRIELTAPVTVGETLTARMRSVVAAAGMRSQGEDFFPSDETLDETPTYYAQADDESALVGVSPTAGGFVLLIDWS